MIKRSVLLLLLLVTAACSATVEPDQALEQEAVQTAVPKQASKVDEIETAVAPVAPTPPPLPVLAPAPDWNNDVWINSDHPLRLADVRGKVVLLEFWTFG